MNDLLSVSGGGSQTDMLVEAFRGTKQPQLDTLKQKKTDLERRLSFFNLLNTRLSSLNSALDKFTATNANDNFFKKTVSSSNADVLSASSSTGSLLGTNSVKVERLASNDMLISSRLNLTDEFGQSGSKAINIKVGDETKTISVEFTGEETNEQAMRMIVKAINSTEDVNVQASFVKDTDSTGRISFTASNTGKSNSIEITGSDMLLTLGVRADQVNAGSDNRTLVNGASAGYKLANTDDLNSKISLNGIEVVRNSNSVEDALEGVTLNLNKIQAEEDSPVVLKTDIDTAGVETFINDILKGFNDLLTHVQSSKPIMRSDSGISSLQTTLRGLSSSAVSSTLGEDSPRYLMEIGITVQDDGTLKLTDKDKLTSVLNDNPQKVADLFTSQDGFIAKIQNTIANLEGDSGLVKLRNKSINEQIDDVKNKTVTMQSRIDSQAESLRKEYNTYLKTFYEAQSQYNLLMTMPTSGASGDYYGLM